MIFQIVSVIVPALVLLLAPLVVKKLGGDRTKYRAWLVAACVLFFVSWYLPSPLVDGRDTAFTTHFLGGGVFSGLLWYYLKRSLGWSAHWLVEAVSLFAFVSVLGAANELFEIVLYAFGGMPHGLGDTSWDLLANTLGSLFFFIFYSIIHTLKSKFYSHDRRH